MPQTRTWTPGSWPSDCRGTNARLPGRLRPGGATRRCPSVTAPSGPYQLVAGGRQASCPALPVESDTRCSWAPSPDQLRLVGVTDTEAVLLARGPDEYHAEPRRLSPLPYLLAGGEVSLRVSAQDRPDEELVAWPGNPRRPRLRLPPPSAQPAARTRRGRDLAAAAHTLMTAPNRTTWSWTLWPPLFQPYCRKPIGSSSPVTRSSALLGTTSSRSPRGASPRPGLLAATLADRRAPSAYTLIRLQERETPLGRR